MAVSRDTARTSAPAGPGSLSTLNTKDMRRILASSFIGTAIEYYDFMLYATASALVFNKVFFANLGPEFALFASFVTLAVGYVARPLGGVVFGHFGDLIGRKKMLVLSMLVMGASTVAIGILPTTAQAGALAPVLLVFVRLVQGLAVGGEWGGAALMALEHAPKEHRGFAAAFANGGGPAGSLVGTLALSLFVAISGNQFLVWGWRIPFLLSAVLIAVGLVIRLKVAETPAFRRLEAEGARKRMPIVDVLHISKRAVALGLVGALGFYVCQAITTVWGVAVAVDSGVDSNWVLNIKATSSVILLVMTFWSARLSDRFGRRRVLSVGAVLGIVLAYPILMLLANGTTWGFALGVFLGNGIVMALLYGPIAAYIAEQFPTRNRYTGASLAYQGASMLGVGFTPMIATALSVATGGALWGIALFWIVVLIAALFAFVAAPEGTGRDLD